MTREDLYKQLCAHDWYYDYSDDGFVWRRGQANEERLRAVLAQEQFPYDFWDIRKSINGLILEDAIEVNPGEYWFPAWSKHGAPIRQQDLITREQHQAIQLWFGNVGHA